MLQVTIPGYEWFDEKTNSFGCTKETTFQLEHSLVSIHRWEQKWCKPFLGKEPKTAEECADYIRCMTLTQHVDPAVYNGITAEVMDKINNYIEAPMTATWFSDKDKQGSPHREVITSEVIYYWMISLNIPWECRKWHLNTLLTLIRVCNAKNAPKKKQSRREMMEQRTAMNKARRARLNSKG